MRKILCFWLCCLFMVSVLTSTGYAQQQSDNHWDIPFLGQMTGTEGFQAIDMESWIKTLEEMIGKNNKDNKDKVLQEGRKKSTPVKPFEMPPGIKIYQLQVNDGKAYHIAAAIALKDDKGSVPGISRYFSEMLEPDEAKIIAEWNEKIRSGIATAQAEIGKSNLANLQVLALKPLERMSGTNEVVYSIGGRVIFSMNGAVMPLYAKMHILERNDKAVVIMVITPDADGRFWEKTTDQLLRSLNK